MSFIVQQGPLRPRLQPAPADLAARESIALSNYPTLTHPGAQASPTRAPVDVDGLEVVHLAPGRTLSSDSVVLRSPLPAPPSLSPSTPSLAPDTPQPLTSSSSAALLAPSNETLARISDSGSSLKLAQPWMRYFVRSHGERLIDKERQTHQRHDWLSMVFATGAGGGKLIASVGASAFGVYAGARGDDELGIGSALMTAGAIVAVAAALIAFGPYVKRNYPDNAIVLKAVSISAAFFMIGGNVAAGFGATRRHDGLKAFGCTTYALGNAMMSVSFRNFVAISELERGRLFLRHRRAASWAMLGAGLVSLLVINAVHQDEHYARGLRVGLMLSAAAVLVCGMAWPMQPRVLPAVLGRSNYPRQLLCAIGIGATMGLSAGNPALPVNSRLKAIALTLCSSPLFGAVAVDESERLRVEIEAEALRHAPQVLPA